MATAQILIPLDIPDVQVLKTELTPAGEWLITVKSTLSTARCHKCGREIRRFHGHDQWLTVRHLPILGHPVYLRYRPRRYRCEACSAEQDTTTTQQLAWHDPRSPNTRAYDDHLLLQLVNATLQDVSAKEAAPYDVVLGVLERRMAARVDWRAYSALGVVGLDEIALKKGHRDFVVIVTARLPEGRVVVLGVLPDRLKETVKQFLASIPAPLQATIHTLCSDMYEGYLNAAKEVLPQAQVVIDRFHVAQKYRQAADTMRKQELKRLKKTLPETDYQQFHGILWLFRKNRADLEPDEQERLTHLFAHSPVLETAYQLREALTEIFELPLSKADAQQRIRAWQAQVRASGLKCFDTFLATVDTWLEEITNYFLQRETSGFVEGLNNKIKVLKRRCYGLVNCVHLFQRLFLDLEGYRLFGPT